MTVIQPLNKAHATELTGNANQNKEYSNSYCRFIFLIKFIITSKTQEKNLWKA